MELISEFQRPTRWYSKLVAAVLALVFFTFLAGAIIAGFVVYRIVTPAANSETIDLANFPGRPEEISYSSDDGMHTGWFFPGLRSAATIVLCPGYQESRGELLPLATALQEHQYNVFLFDFGPAKAGGETSTLGFREAQQLRAAVTALAQRDDVDRMRFGVWGTNVGAYAALNLAENDPRIRAIVAESVFDRPQDMVRMLTASFGLSHLPLLPGMVEHGFVWANFRYRAAAPLSANLFALAGVPKLFLGANDDADMISSTHRLYLQSPEPKDEELLPVGNYAGMLDDEKRDYENRITSFFLLNLPARAGNIR